VFEAFPGNYWWSAMVMNSLAMGGEMSEIAPVLVALRAAAERAPGPAERAEWSAAWHRLGQAVRRLADRDNAAALPASARRKYLRAANYMFIAEVVEPAHDQDARKLGVYADAQRAFRLGIALEQSPVELVEVPFENSSLPALFVPAAAGSGKAPCMIHFDGKDDVKEVTYLRHRQGLAERGISLLIVDHPGSGEAVRNRGLHARPDIEVAATACVDYLRTRADVDIERLGIIAQSFGGYYAPRAAAFEKRLKLCIVWGALWDAAAVVAETGTPVSPEAWLMLGQLDNEQAVQQRLADFSLESVINELESALIVLHGASDRQVPLWAAERTVARAVNAASADLRIFSADEHGDQHCQVDLVSQATDYIADRVAAFFYHERSDHRSLQGPAGSTA